MGDRTSIEWTDMTWNPIRGCSRVSEGCRHCYAEGVAARFSGPGLAYEGLAVMGNNGPRWTGEIRFVEEHLLDPIRKKRPRLIFVDSMSDLFHEKVSDDMIDRIFAVMALSPQHVFQVLTKRPERMRDYLAAGHRAAFVEGRAKRIARECGKPIPPGKMLRWPLPNVWFGVSVEDQVTAEERIPFLLRTPAAVRWISAEPLLGPVDLSYWLEEPENGCGQCGAEVIRGMGNSYEQEKALLDTCVVCGQKFGEWSGRLSWVVCGGESGHGARPMHPGWVRSLRDQCVAAGVAFHFKQWGAWEIASAKNGYHGGVMPETGERFTWVGLDGRTANPSSSGLVEPYSMAKAGKKKSGRILDGRTWDEYPVVEAVP